MSIIDYSREPKSDIAFVDMKSFYASVECVKRNLHPLKTSLCVMSRADNSNGLILASSPTFKKVFGKSNVTRSRDLPFDIETRKFNFEACKKAGIKVSREYIDFVEKWAKKTLIVPPRMAIYIKESLKIQQVFENYAPKIDIHPYSIDEGFIDLTNSLDYFIPSKSISRKEKLDIISAKIQKEIYDVTGIFSAVGMSNSNPLLAKLCLDNEAKKKATMRANWSYEDVESKVWKIKNLTDFWGIGEKTAKRLNKLGIYSIYDLANFNPDILQEEFGVIGVKLWFHANGVDESKASSPYIPKQTTIGNSQILPRDYTNQSEIELVLSELTEQVSTRLRKLGKKASVVAINIGFSYIEDRKAINTQIKINPSNSTTFLTKKIIDLFRSRYIGGAVRSVGVRLEKLVDKSYISYSLFDNVEKINRTENLDTTIDKIRDEFGFVSIQKASSLMSASRIKTRSKLIGGHSGGLEDTDG